MALTVALFCGLLIFSVFGRLCATQEVLLSTLHCNFTLAAWNSTLPNANSTGAPLVLGQDGATHGMTLHVASTYASFPYDDYPYLGLVNGSLRAYAADGSWTTNATEVQSGGTLGWVTSTLYRANAPQVYSSLESDPYYLLAAHGFYDLWSLCPFPASGQTNVVFNVSDTSQDYDSTQWYPVQIHVVPIS